MLLFEYQRYSRTVDDKHCRSEIEYDLMISARFQLLGGTVKSIDGLTVGGVDHWVIVFLGLFLVEYAQAYDGEDEVDAAHVEGEDCEVTGVVEEH